MNSQELDRLPGAKAVQVLCRRFRWLAPRASELREWVAWQDVVRPRPNVYFRWHLPRFVTTVDLLDRAVAGLDRPRVLDLASYAPYALLMERRLGGQGVMAPRWTRTSLEGAPLPYEVAGTVQTLEHVRLDLTEPSFPFKDASFDVIVLTEVIEHIDRHPQDLLREINRVLAPGGRLVMTTPNVTSWKKLLLLSGGDWTFDAPTFGGKWGHRYEYSFYQMREALRRSGFEPRVCWTRDVYFDDPLGVSQAVQFVALASAKAVTGQVKSAARMVSRRGSGLFFVGHKIREVRPNEPADYLPI